ncbi:MAG TPA: hypothetical protein VK574_04365 [Terracidiphilus sp.]|nr:hypothetical protein [Terracidiphilus sp.]
MMYGATGACTTDDSTAIQKAENVAATTHQVLYFPLPPGGCYLMSITWHGTTFVGQQAGTQGQPVILRSKPGLDVLHVLDPTSNTFIWNKFWKMENIFFLVDNSSAGNFPHRWPGRWFDDATIPSGNLSTLYTANSQINCSDIGQAIQVNGAGPSGANLVTTIASVAPCWSLGGASNSSWIAITLTSPASRTVTNAHAYLSLLGLPVTTNIGNCAIGMDDVDGNTADWTNPWQAAGSLYSSMSNISFYAVNTGTNNVCGVYTQGTWGMYGLDVQNFEFRGQTFGVVIGSSELNSFDQSSAGDYMKFNHGSLESITYPWIQVNGQDLKIEDTEITAQNGPQFVGLGNVNFDAFKSAQISVPEFEGNTGTYGYRVEGAQNTFTNTELTGGAGATAYLETQGARCINCSMGGGTLNVGGADNKLDFSSLVGVTVNDLGLGNRIWYGTNPNPFDSIPQAYSIPAVPTKGLTDQSGRVSGDFIRDGNFSTPYNSENLLIWPNDILFNKSGTPGLWPLSVQKDAASPSGAYVILPINSAIASFAQFSTNNFNLTVGTNIPAGLVTVSAMAKCPSAYALSEIAIAANGSLLNGTSITCSTKYQLYSFTANLAPYSGKNIGFETTSANRPYVAWIGIQPAVTLQLGSSTAITQAADDNSTKVATTAQVQAALASAFASRSALGNTTPESVHTKQLFGNPSTGVVSVNKTSASDYLGQFNLKCVGFVNGADGTMCATPLSGNQTYTLPDLSGIVVLTSQLPLSGTTGPIGGSALAAGACATGTVSIRGATASMVAAVSPAGGTSPGTGYVWEAQVTNSGTVTVSVCAIAAGSPTRTTYNVRVIQ